MVLIVIFAHCNQGYPLHSQNNRLSPLLEFTTANNVTLYWDTLNKTGMLMKGNTVLTFNLELPIALVNFQEQYAIDPLQLKNYSLYATNSTLEVFQKILLDPLRQKENTTALLPKTAERGANSRVTTVIIDPGHGGKDPGAVGKIVYNNQKYIVMEKDIVLEVSLLVSKYLTKFFPNLEVVLTRMNDSYLSLEQRILLSNKYLNTLKDGELILFISMHANAAFSSGANGYEIWYLPSDYNRNDLIGQHKQNSQLHSIINRLRDSEITLESIELARLVLKSINSGLEPKFENRGLKENEWYVVRNAKMPAILIELGFVSNSKEGYFLMQKQYQTRLAQTIANGIKEYMELFDVSGIK